MEKNRRIEVRVSARIGLPEYSSAEFTVGYSADLGDKDSRDGAVNMAMAYCKEKVQARIDATAGKVKKR